MATATFHRTHTSTHHTAEKALRRLIRTLETALAAEPARSDARDHLSDRIDATRRKLRALDAQTPSAAGLWARTATDEITTLHQDYPQLPTILRRRKAARGNPHAPTTPRGRLRDLLTRRLAQLAAEKKAATGEAKQTLGVEYNRVENWIDTLDGMGNSKVNELLFRLEN